MSKNVAVFVDVANIFYAAKAAGVDIDYVTLLKSASAGRDLVRAYAYTGLDPDNENQRNFHSFLARHGYRVVSKDIRKYGDGKVKANLDIELVVDMMKTARNLDIAIVVSGDGDFAPAIRAVQEQGVRVEVISFRGNTSSDLIEVADQFTDITALAKVEKGSSRSGRRVAESDEDLSMTEVPDKQTEGVGGGRGGRGGRGRGGRGRGREDLEPAARTRRPVGEPAAVTSSGAPLVVLPGEKLSKVAAAGAVATGPIGPIGEADDELEDPETGGAVAAFGGGLRGATTLDVEAGAQDALEGEAEADGEREGDDADAEARRRRRRRGGRGRGRGRGREGEGEAVTERPQPISASVDDEEVFEEPVAAPRGPRTTPFGSVWDSQLGVPTMPAASGVTPLGDDEDFEEPEIPEYLIAERRDRGRQGPGQGQRGGRGGPRGGRSAYGAAMDRERYGGGRGGGGLNRYPDVSGRERPVEPRRDDRFARPVGGGAPGGGRSQGGGAQGGGGGPRRGGGDEPWSEVPPELEAMLRAQLGNRPVERRPQREAPPASQPDTTPPAAEATPAPQGAEATEPAAFGPAPEPEAEVAPARRGRRPARPAPDADAAPIDGGPAEEAVAATAEAAVPKRRATRRTAATAADAVPAETDAEAPAAPKRRTTRKAAAPVAGDGSVEPAAAMPEAGSTADAGVSGAGADAPGAGSEAPKRRVTRRKPAADSTNAATPADAGGTGGTASGEDVPAAAPKRRTTRRKVGEESPGG